VSGLRVPNARGLIVEDPGRTSEDPVVQAARMVEVGDKDVTDREAVAECTVRMTPQAVAKLVEGTPKGNPLEAARVAGLLAVKRTPELLPFCHPIRITGAEVEVEASAVDGVITVRARVRASDRTGVEMESLTGAAVAALSLYDTAKAYDRATVISDLRLRSKSGGRSGNYRAPDS
jgi:cyclic pyranopterin phosphate synthase